MARFGGKGALRASRVENDCARIIVVGWDPLSTKTALYWGLDRTSPLQPFDHSKVVLKPIFTLLVTHCHIRMYFFVVMVSFNFVVKHSCILPPRAPRGRAREIDVMRDMR